MAFEGFEVSDLSFSDSDLDDIDGDDDDDVLLYGNGHGSEDSFEQVATPTHSGIHRFERLDNPHQVDRVVDEAMNFQFVEKQYLDNLDQIQVHEIDGEFSCDEEEKDAPDSTGTAAAPKDAWDLPKAEENPKNGELLRSVLTNLAQTFLMIVISFCVFHSVDIAERLYDQSASLLDTPPEPMNISNYVWIDQVFPPNGTSTTVNNLDSLESLPEKRDFLRNAYLKALFNSNLDQSLDQPKFDFFLDSKLDNLDSLTTLWLMDLREEFQVAHLISLSKRLTYFPLKNEIKNGQMHLREAVTRVIGSLVSGYALTKDPAFLEQAHALFGTIGGAYQGTTGIPYKYLPFTWLRVYQQLTIGEAVDQQLELSYLARLTNYENYPKRVKQFLSHLQENRQSGMYPNVLNIGYEQKEAESRIYYTAASEFYGLLVKSFIQSNQKDLELLNMFQDAVDALEQNGLIRMTQVNGVETLSIRDFDPEEQKYQEPERKNGECQLGVMFALGANAMEQTLALNDTTGSVVQKLVDLDRVSKHWKIADVIVEQCRRVLQNGAVSNGNLTEEDMILYRHLSESYFTLHRLTHDPKYRHYAWQLAQAISSKCATRSPVTTHLHPIFKYLYLTFSPDHILPLDQWVFTTTGQPLPIHL